MPAHVYNAGWYADNEGRKYPIDSVSSAVDDFGEVLNHGILVDLSVSFPDSAGSGCMLSGVLITDYMLTAVFSTESGPLASVVVQQPVKPFYHYDLNPLQEGVAGVVVFGSEAVTARGSWRFSSMSQSGILPSCYTAMTSFPVISIGLANGSAPLTGTVSFIAGPDIVVSASSTFFGAVSPLGYGSAYSNRALWIGLDTVTNDPVAILRKYTSPCDARTEEDTCRRSSISSLGGAAPDCSGFLSLAGSGGITITSTGNNIVTVDYNKTLESVCPTYSVGSMLTTANCEVYSVQGAEAAAGNNTENNDPAPAMAMAAAPAVPSSVNLYTSAIQVESGGLEYGDTRGVTNVPESGSASFYVTVPTSATGILFTVSGSGTATLSDGSSVITLNSSGVLVNGSLELTTTFPFITRLGAVSRINNQVLSTLLNIHNLHITLQGSYCSDIYYE